MNDENTKFKASVISASLFVSVLISILTTTVYLEVVNSLKTERTVVESKSVFTITKTNYIYVTNTVTVPLKLSETNSSMNTNRLRELSDELTKVLEGIK